MQPKEKVTKLKKTSVRPADRGRKARIRGTLNVSPEMITNFVVHAAPAVAALAIPIPTTSRAQELSRSSHPVTLALAQSYLPALSYAPRVEKLSGVSKTRLSSLLLKRMAIARAQALATDLEEHAEDSGRLLALAHRLFHRVVLGNVRAQLVDPLVPPEIKTRLKLNFGDAMAEQDRWMRTRMSETEAARKIKAEFTNSVALIQARNRLAGLVRSMVCNEPIDQELLEELLESASDEWGTQGDPSFDALDKEHPLRKAVRMN